jgi:uncharacterized membrane protein YheB (UPF0754 family)
MGDKDIKVFDVTEHIRNKVRQVLVSEIPDDQMDAMIKREFANYFREGSTTYPYESSGDGMKIIREEISNIIRQKVKDWLDKNFQREWDDVTNSEKLVGEAVAKLAPIVQNALVTDITQKAIAIITRSI